MILKKDMLTKAMKRGRTSAVALLNDLSRTSGLPDPHYDYEPGGSVKKRSHFYKVRFRVPQFLLDSRDVDRSLVVGAGRCTTKKNAKSLAALEAVHRLEEAMDVSRGGIPTLLEEYRKRRQEEKEQLEALPVEKEIPGVSWDHLPVDMSFPEQPTRRGRIDFFPLLRRNHNAFTAAKAITLASKGGLPQLAIHANQTDCGILQQWANLRTHDRMLNVNGPVDKELNMGVSKQEAEVLALEQLRKMIMRKTRTEDIVKLMERKGNDSFGMAKLFVKLPEHQLQDLKDLLQQVEKNPIVMRKENTVDRRRRHQRTTAAAQCTFDLKSRLESFRAHQQKYPLPIDSVESDIPQDALVTIVRGGTGSGKTTRYPLMLSLLSQDDSTKVVVAQPRRLACQTAARRVAYEQGFELGKEDCPIGYQIRFESFASRGNRTVDFATPGVLLRQASMDDPLFRDVTHLVIDEVHERNADMDLLLALAKQAVRRRANHETLPPLRLVLMSATLDSTLWESYFDETVAIVDAPETRRFSIDMVHLDEKMFPTGLKSISLLRGKGERHNEIDYDDALCKVTAELALSVFNKHELKNGGSILCFLPGMDEIRLVHRLIRQQSRDSQGFTVRYLHSSLSSQEQAMVFQPGPKIILSTNLAETSVTIPDVKVVIDTGRERQHSLLESSSLSETTTVVGSQLATVNISQASAKQRAGRAGRVSAGTCYRLYTKRQLETEFPLYTLPEMLRMELSQIVLHSLSAYHPSSGHSLHLLLDAPDPPTATRLRQTLRGLASQGLVDYDPDEEHDVNLTPLGRVVSSLPVSPRLGRLLFVGLTLCAIEPALNIAALLSVPKVFSSNFSSSDGPYCSDIIQLLEKYEDFLQKDIPRKDIWRYPGGKLFEQVSRVKRQLEGHIKSFLCSSTHADMSKQDTDWSKLNANSNRVGALAGLICVATPHIAHLTSGKSDFATRDVAGTAKMHPSSVNFGNERRVHWYVYHELRSTRHPYLHVTTAVSQLELALFAEASGMEVCDDDDDDIDEYYYDESRQQNDNWLFVADQWVPVDVTKPSHRETLLKLRRLLMRDMLQQVAQDPASVLASADYDRIVLFVLSALEQQRLSK